MKTITNLLFLLALTPALMRAQWMPGTTSIDPPIHRNGSVGIGLAPAARLHVAKGLERAIEIKDPGWPPSLPGSAEAHLRLTTQFLPNIGVKIWELDADTELQFRTDATADNQLATVMSVNDLGLRVNGQRVAIGAGGQQVNIGYHQGHYLAFGFRPALVQAGLFQAINNNQGGSLLHANSLGDFKISTFLSGTGTFTLGEQTRLTVTRFGHVGIGTEDPQSLLHIDSRDQGLRISNWEGGGWDLLPLNSQGEQAFGLRAAHSQLPLWVMKKDGRMGIGTQQTPTTLGGDNISAYRLFVEGGILSKEVRVRTLWADHVFEPAYRLATLPEVEAHIRLHGRLPDTPSAAHIESSGLELGSMTVQQQVKIEELFLHLIALEKRVAELEAAAGNKAEKAKRSRPK